MQIALVFVLSLLVLLGIGIASSLRASKSTSDYLLAGRDVSPWLVGLSAVATNNSGYMFIGMIGYTYTEGLSSIWLMFGWIIGDFLMTQIAAKNLRVHSGDSGALSFTEALARWTGEDWKWVRRLGGLITFLFLAAYAGAQLKAGSKALHVFLEWPLNLGSWIGAIAVLLYCWAGGIRASIWTDAAQSFVMLFSMAVLLWTGMHIYDSNDMLLSALHSVQEGYLNWFPKSLEGHPGRTALFLLGWLFGGMGVIGQPHIMIRFMTLGQAKEVNRARVYYYLWFTLFYGLTIGVGLLTRVLLDIPTGSTFDAELALPKLALQLLPAAWVGVILAGLFSATLSTADSQILSCTSAITRDLFKNKTWGYWSTKLVTIFITALALFIALAANTTVFSLVLIAWSALASCFGPLLITLALGGDRHITEAQALTMMITGLLTVVAWQALGLGTYCYEILPGMLSGWLVYGLFQIKRVF